MFETMQEFEERVNPVWQLEQMSVLVQSVHRLMLQETQALAYKVVPF